MPILDAALAFALTMLVVATLVTQIVRIAQGLFRLRRNGLRVLLNDFVDNELEPVIRREMKRLEKGLASDFASAVGQLAGGLEAEVPESEARTTPALFGPKELASLVEVSTEELVERLKRSELGEKLLAELGEKAQPVFDELGRRYEVVGKKATESFRKHSRLWAFGVAFFLALVVNIDSIRILDTYFRSQSAREGVIAHRDALVGELYRSQVASLEARDRGTSPSQMAFSQAFRDAQKQFDDLVHAGLPIGWSYWPHSVFWVGEPEPPKTAREYVTSRVSWALGILLTAFLAGLGAPFWYDAVAGISRVSQGARAARMSAEQKTSGTGGS